MISIENPRWARDLENMSTTSDAARYEKNPLPRHRELLSDLASLVPKHPVQILVEFDVTRARTYIRRHRKETGETLSFTGWLIRCIAQAVGEHKHVQAYRKGKRLIVFDDVDIGFTIEREPEGMVAGAIVRKANEKTVREVHNEIRAAQTEKSTHGPIVGETEEARLASSLQKMPGIVRKLAVWRYRRDPILRKRTQGTVGITSVGNIMGPTSGVWICPIVSGPYPLFFGIGAISKTPRAVENRIEPGEYLPMSVTFDHDAVDGAGAVRFLKRLGEILKEGHGLEGAEPPSTP